VDTHVEFLPRISVANRCGDCGAHHDVHSPLALVGEIPEVPADAKPRMPGRIVHRMKGDARQQWGLQE
jgi:hypothetical protein